MSPKWMTLRSDWLIGRKVEAALGVQISKFEGQHAEGAALIHAEGFAHPWPQHEFMRLAATPSCRGHVAVSADGKGIVGFVISQLAADEAEILSIAVSKAKRHQGLGRQLLSVHLPELSNLGTRSLFLEVDATNVAALALYRSYGFEEIGRRASYYKAADGGPASDALMMRISLD